MWQNIEQVKKIISNSFSKSEVLKNLGLKNNGGNFNTLTHFILRNSIDLEHFKNIGKKGGYKIYKSLDEVLIENSPYQSSNHLKNKLYKLGLKERKCEKCGQTEIWNNEKISLILDHINGDRHDNRIGNLRIVCPNCNATLDTHCRGLNVKNKDYYDLCNCGNKKRIESKGCFECYNIIRKKDKVVKIVKDKKGSRKIERPPYKQLIEEIEELGYSGTGRKYNVSDNSIRKWRKMYEKYGENF